MKIKVIVPCEACDGTGWLKTATSSTRCECRTGEVEKIITLAEFKKELDND